MKTIYLLGGLGVDKRIFSGIRIDDHPCVFLDWIPPKENEDMSTYARRMIERFFIERNSILIGVSFGGIMMLEIAKHLTQPKIVLISSARSPRELPFIFRLCGALYLDRLAPVPLMKMYTPITAWLFGAQTRVHKKILAGIIKDTDPHFAKWALGQIVRWKSKVIANNVVTIHGTNDRLLPANNADYKISGAGHFVIVTHARETNTALNKVIEADRGGLFS